MAKYKLVNGVQVELTAEEVTQSEAEEAAAKVEEDAVKFKISREINYPSLPEQFDQLFRDITAGKFGDDAKTGEWYIAIKNVKDSNPKPS